jgi:RNA polymerase sigma factor (sigma-70 family)
MSKILDGLPEHSLTPDEENIFARRIQKFNSTPAIQALVLHNMREAIPYATRCCRAGLEESEVFSLCYSALMKAVSNFKPDNIRFFAYAKVYIRGEISRTWKKRDVVKASSLHETSPEPVFIRRMITGEDRESEREWVVRDIKPIEPDFVDPEFRLIDLKEKWRVVEPLIRRVLGDRERTIIKLYYEAGFPFEEIGDLLVPNISRQRVQIIHNEAIVKLRRALIHDKKLEI